MNEDASKPVIQSYVYFEDKCFMVSTIERASSGIDRGRFNETIVWNWDKEKRERTEMIYQDAGPRGSLKKHFAICQEFYQAGKMPEEQ